MQRSGQVSESIEYDPMSEASDEAYSVLESTDQGEKRNMVAETMNLPSRREVGVLKGIYFTQPSHFISRKIRFGKYAFRYQAGKSLLANSVAINKRASAFSNLARLGCHRGSSGRLPQYVTIPVIRPWKWGFGVTETTETLIATRGRSGGCAMRAYGV